jgi:hypothetical protein
MPSGLPDVDLIVVNFSPNRRLAILATPEENESRLLTLRADSPSEIDALGRLAGLRSYEAVSVG